MMNRLKNPVVVITGASSGIGRASAAAMARRGARLVLAARNEAALKETLAECECAGGRGIVQVTGHCQVVCSA